MEQNNYISASKIKLFDSCPYCFYLRYVVGLPSPNKTYFQLGKDVEANLQTLLTGNELENKNSYEAKLAHVLCSNKKFQELIVDQELVFQNKLETEVNGIPFLAYTDIETKDVVIDIKTSATKWSAQTIQDYKYQAIAYSLITKKPFYFVVIKKATNPTSEDVQVISVKVSEQSIKDFCEKVKFVWDIWQNDLLGQAHTGGYRCLFPKVTHQ